MSFFLDTVSYLSPGIKTKDVGFPAAGYQIVVGAKNGGTNFATTSTGTSDGTFQLCTWEYTKGSVTRKDPRYTDRMVFVKEWNGSAWVVKTHAVHESIVGNVISFEVLVHDPNYPYEIRAWG